MGSATSRLAGFSEEELARRRRIRSEALKELAEQMARDAAEQRAHELRMEMLRQQNLLSEELRRTREETARLRKFAEEAAERSRREADEAKRLEKEALEKA